MIETIPTQKDFPEAIQLLRELVVHRCDAFAKQRPDGRYECKKERLTNVVLEDHLAGTRTIGSYLINPANQTVKNFAYDIDGDPKDLGPQKAACNLIRQRLLDSNIPRNCCLTEFTGRKGYRIVVFLNPPVSAAAARNFALKAIGNLKIPDGASIEVFPKQSHIERGRYGNLVKLFFALHKKSGKRAHLVDPASFEPQPWTALRAVKPWRMPPELVAQMEAHQKAELVSREPLSTEDYPCWIKISTGNIPQGARHDSGLFYAAHLRDQKLSLEAVLNVMKIWWQRIVQPPEATEAVPWKDIERAVKDAYNRKYSVGCSTIRERWPNLCDPNCPVRKREEACQKFKSGNVKVLIDRGICNAGFDDAPRVRLVVKREGKRWRYHTVVIGESGLEAGIAHMSSSPPWEENRAIWKKIEDELAEAGMENPHDALVAVGKLLIKNGAEGLFEKPKTAQAPAPSVLSELKPDIEAEAERILGAEDPLAEIGPHLDNIAAGEKDNKQLIFTLGLSGKIKDPRRKQVIILKGEPGAGKSTLMRVADAFRVKDVGRFTPHALDYANLEGYDILRLKEIGVMDQESQGVSTLKFLSADDRGYAVEATVKDPETGGMTTKTYRIPPITVITSTTRVVLDPQFERRAWIINADESPEQTERVKEFEAKLERERGEVLLGWRKVTSFDYSQAVLKEVVNRIGNCNVVVPFPKTLFDALGAKKLRVRGDFAKMSALVVLYTVLDRRKAPNPQVDKKEVLIATPLHAVKALKLARAPLTSMLMDVERRTQALLDIMSRSAVAPGDSIDVSARREYAKEMGLSERRISYLLDELCDSGYATKTGGGRGKPKFYSLLYSPGEIKEEGEIGRLKTPSVFVSQLVEEGRKYLRMEEGNTRPGGCECSLDEYFPEDARSLSRHLENIFHTSSPSEMVPATDKISTEKEGVAKRQTSPSPFGNQAPPVEEHLDEPTPQDDEYVKSRLFKEFGMLPFKPSQVRRLFEDDAARERAWAVIEDMQGSGDMEILQLMGGNKAFQFAWSYKPAQKPPNLDQTERIRRVFEVVALVERQYEGGAPVREVRREAEADGISQSDLDEAINRGIREGVLYEPRAGSIAMAVKSELPRGSVSSVSSKAPTAQDLEKSILSYPRKTLISEDKMVEELNVPLERLRVVLGSLALRGMIIPRGGRMWEML